MTKYFYKRLLLIIPTLILISMIGFLFSRNVPQDPATALVNIRGGERDGGQEKNYAAAYKELGLDKPDFYFSLVPHTYPRTLNVISSKTERKKIKQLLTSGLSYSIIEQALSSAESEYLRSTRLQALKASARKSSGFFFPKFYWHGSDNQYHHWWSSLLRGSFGKSYVNGKEATAVVGKALIWTSYIGLGSLLFSFITALLIGFWLAKHAESRRAELLNTILYILFSIPIFWLATMMVIYFTTDDYGSWTNIFPSVGIEVQPGKSTLTQVLSNTPKFILPIFCGSLATIAFIARMLRKSILNEMQLPYIVTAYSKGLSQQEVLRRHALPNALFPLLTIFVGAIPLIIGGSVVVEVIFNIPGMGRLLYNSIGVADWNVVFCILMLTGFITILSYLLGDVLYAYVNPKIRFA